MAVRGDRGRWLAVLLACIAPAAADSGKHVCVNEFLASNSTSLADGQGQYDDWIELYNPGPAPVDIGGMFLTDDLREPTKWHIPDRQPQRTTIPAGGFILIWADGDSNDPGLHASFRLSRWQRGFAGMSRSLPSGPQYSFRPAVLAPESARRRLARSD